MSTISTAVRTFDIDKAHSEAAFQVRHLLSKVRGRFADFSGTLEFDPNDPTQSKIALTIQAASVDTNTPARDAHLRSEDFFDVDTYPVITFVSTAVAPRGQHEFVVSGDLTIRGVTKRIDAPVSYLGLATDPYGNQKVAFEGEVAINRKDFGLNWNAALETGGFLVGDEVKISVSLQAAESK